MRGIFVTGTGTEVGKSVVAAAICAALGARGKTVAAYKPVITGIDQEGGSGWPPDHELLAKVATAGQPAHEIAPMRFEPPVSPHLAAAKADADIDPRALLDGARRVADGRDFIVVEGIGGLMVPFTPGYLVRDLALDLGLPVVIASNPNLGTINHTLLTIEAARSGGLELLAVVMTPWPEDPDEVQQSNRDVIETLGNVSVCGLPETTPDDLARAGDALPIDEWLGESEADTAGSGLDPIPTDFE